MQQQLVMSKAPAAPKPESDGQRPLKIVMVAHKFPPFMGGIEMHVQQVGQRMVALGHSVTVITADPEGKLQTEDEMSGMRIRRVRAYPSKSDIFFSPGVYGLVGSEPCDVVHVQGYHTLTPPVAMLAAIRRHIPFVMTFHSGGHSSSARQRVRAPQHAVMGPLVRRASQLIGVSEFEADHFSALMQVPRSRFVVVPNGARFEAPKDPIVADPEAPLLVSIGRLERYKGHHRAIDAFAELVRQRPRARLRILGEGPYKGELVEQVARLGLEDSVVIGGIPPAERQEMARILSSAALVVLLSDYEAHPIAVLEALSLGKKVLAVDTSGFREMGAKGLIRCLPLESTATQVAAAMVDELDSKRDVVPVALPTWDDCTRQLLAIYRDVIASKVRVDHGH